LYTWLNQLKLHKREVLHKLEKNAEIYLKMLENSATMDLNCGTLESWNLPEDAGKIVARWMCNVPRWLSKFAAK